MNIINGVIKIFHDVFNYENINKINSVKIRKCKLPLQSVVLYNFLCTQKEVTKESVVADVNIIDNIVPSKSRQAYKYKNDNIDTQIYENCFGLLTQYYNTCQDTFFNK